MPDSIVIHVGFPRTGSTFLQRTVFPLLNDQDTCFVERDDEVRDFLDRIKSFGPQYISASELNNKWKSVLGRYKKNTIIISDEGLIGDVYNNFNNIESIAECLNNGQIPVKIILVIRRQDRLLESLFKMFLMKGYFHDISTFLGYRDGVFMEVGKFMRNNKLGELPLPRVNVFNLDYNNYIDIYDRIFGSKNVLVLPFEYMLDDPKSFSARISEHAGSGICPEIFTDNQINSGMTTRTATLAMFLNRVALIDCNSFGFLPFKSKTECNQSKKGVLAKSVGNLHLTRFYRWIDKLSGKGKDYLSDRMRIMLLEYYDISNRALSKRIGIELDKYEYYKL